MNTWCFGGGGRTSFKRAGGGVPVADVEGGGTEPEEEVREFEEPVRMGILSTGMSEVREEEEREEGSEEGGEERDPKTLTGTGGPEEEGGGVTVLGDSDGEPSSGRGPGATLRGAILGYYF